MTLFSRASFLDILLFTKHLSVMVKSGITVAESVKSLKHQAKTGAFKRILDQVSADIENGDPLAKALAKYPQAFSHFYINLIAIGEESGVLQENLDFLSKQLSKEYALRKKVQGVLLYPAIVLTAAFVISALVSIFVLPKLVNLFESFDVVLPLSTRILLSIAHVMQSHGVIIFVTILAASIFFRVLAFVPQIRKWYHWLFLSMPIIGPFLRNVYISSSCRDLGMMLQAGLSITRALRVEYDTINNLVFKEYVKSLQLSIARGGTLSGELLTGNFSKIPPLVSKMIEVGEGTGKLEESLLYLGDFFEEEIDNTSKNFSTVLEPILLLCIGLVVAFVALAIISPIYSLTGSVHR
ncbi:MAG: type II secretion system F family protein [Candidatus Moranbacteria bacterium]|nr:type II secretion system F family protein [Candidatus Moranbacteria bacterium]